MVERRARIEALPGGSGFATALAALTALVSLTLVGLFRFDLGMVPHLALAPMFFWVTRGQAGTGPIGAFLVGLIVDVFTSGPLGVAAAGYLAFHGLARREAGALVDMPLSGRVAYFALLAGGVTVVHGLATFGASAVEASEAEVAVALVATLAGYPLIALLAGPDRRRRRRSIKGLGA